jgi:carbohydrate-selective porin OprB
MSPRRPLWLPLAVAIVAAAWPAAAVAEGGLSGAWGGGRGWLAARGLAVEPVLTAEAFANLRGGLDPGRRGLRGTGDLVLTFVTDPLLWAGGAAVVFLQAGIGPGITERGTGAVQPFSNLEAHDFAQLSEAFLAQRLLDGNLVLTVGRLDANRDFGTPRNAADFLNGSFGVPPTVPMPSFPEPAAGAVVVLQAHPRLALRTGIYDGRPTAGQIGRSGGLFAVASVVNRWGLTGPQPAGFAGLGAWYHGGAPVAPDPARAYGVYGIAGQRLMSGRWSDGGGLFAFARAGLSPDDRATVSSFGALGLVLRDALPGRRDAAGIALSRVGLGHGQRLGRSGVHETTIESFVRARLAPSIDLQPDLQCALSPAGHLPASVTAGVRLIAGL